MTSPQRQRVEDPGAGPQRPHDQETRSSSIGRRLLVAGGARLVVLPVTGICSLLIARLITGAAGVQRFGEIMLIATLSQLLVFADLGVGAAVATESARLRSDSGDEESFRRTLLTALRTVVVCFAGLTVTAVLISLIGLWPVLLGIHGTDAALQTQVNVAAALALISFGASLPFALAEPVLRGAGHLHLAVLLIGLSPPLALLITLGLYRVGAPPFAYAVAIPIGALLGALCCAGGAALRVGRVLRGLPRQVFQRRRYPGLPVAGTAVPMFVVMVGLPLALQSDRVIISHRLDPATLSEFSYVSQLYMPTWSVVAIAAGALWPIFAAGKSPGLRASWLRGLRLLGSAGVALAIVFVLLAGPVVRFMSGGTAAAELSLLVSFAGLLIVQSLHVGTGMLLISPRQLRFQAMCVLALVVTNLPLSWFLAPVLGASGPVVASILTVAACQLVPGLVAAHKWTAPGGVT